MPGLATRPARTILSLGLVFGLMACAPPHMNFSDVSLPGSGKPEPKAASAGAPGRITLTPVRYAELPGWKEDDLAPGLTAFLKSCERMWKQNFELPVGGENSPTLDGRAGRIIDWLPACAAARGVVGKEKTVIRYFFESWFRPHLATDHGDPRGLFTGYYEAELRGHWNPTKRYRYPIYARPRDLISVNLARFSPDLIGKDIHGRIRGNSLVPYATREDIEKGYLKDKGLEILFVDDPVDAFFLQIQGSGRVIMEDGTTVSLGYAGKNGHPYTSIGRRLIDMGAMNKDEISMSSIRDWLLANPDRARTLLWENKSFVFFEQKEAGDPLGAEGVPLTPGRSIAVDRSIIPFGLPIWLDTTDPLTPVLPLRRLVVAQDTGGAIRGPIRGDLFWGHGDEAEEKAGNMKQRGRYYILLPREPGSVNRGS